MSVCKRTESDYFAQKHCTKKQYQSECQKRRALKSVKRLKNESRHEFQKAKKDGFSPENIQPLAHKFFDLVRERSQVKRSEAGFGLLTMYIWVCMCA